MLKVHNVKILPEYFDEVIELRKKAEFRIDDRDYKVGDLVCLNEYCDGSYTGFYAVVKITHILKDVYGLPMPYAILSFDFLYSGSY